ncbi:DNA annealing helicase and endonuclease ZRANB3-like [Littorina saxatilis]
MKSKRRSVNDEDIMKELPTRLVTRLMPFQREGIIFAVKKEGRCLIADEMGLGKTLQAIAVAYYFRAEWPLLIIVPSSLRYVWIEELEKWLPDVLPHEINLIQGGFDTGGIADAKITIVTYGLLSCKSSATVKEALQTRKFNVAICDESHYFKNSRTECCKAVTPLLTAAKRCLLLSGTPAVARPAELFTQLDALLPGKFGSFWSFTKKYCAARWEHFGRRRQWKVDGASNLEELQQRLESIMIRREKSKVLTQLPPKQRQKILFPLKDSNTKKEIVATFAELKPLLKKSKSPLAADLRGGGPDGVNAPEQQDTNILSRIQRLYKLTGEAKVGPTREYIQMLCENVNLKFLVFAYHHNMMDGLQQTLWDKKVKFVRIDGHTKPSERQMYVQQFQNDKDTRVAILSILAAGTGLTLTAATLVVFAELYWTPGVMVQCEDRAHRIGQASTVAVHYLVARDTMDEWVWSAVCKKTLVTSTALTGKTQALQADAGDSFQVELLSAAEAYTPAENAENNIDIMGFLQSQRPQDQKSIRDFFSSQNEPMDTTGSSCQLSSQNQPGCSQSTESNVDLSRKEDLSATTSTPLDKGKKKPFSLFTSLKKLSSSTQKSSKASILIDSSDEESVDGKPKATHTKTPGKLKKDVSRKRKCSVVATHEISSDSEFEQIPPLSVSKKQKLGSKASSSSKASACNTPKSLTKSVPVRNAASQNKETSVAGTGDVSVTTVPGTSSKKETSDVKEWSCSACTFHNNTLLPFCEMCETPRKQKAKTDMDVSAETPVLRDNRGSTLKSEHNSDKEEEPLFSRRLQNNRHNVSRHKAKRSLMLNDDDKLQAEGNTLKQDSEEKTKTGQQSALVELNTEHMDSDSSESFKSPGGSDQEPKNSNVAGRSLKDPSFKCVQQNTSSEVDEDDDNFSRESEAENDSKDSVPDDEEHITSFSSGDSEKDCNLPVVKRSKRKCFMLHDAIDDDSAEPRTVNEQAEQRLADSSDLVKNVSSHNKSNHDGEKTFCVGNKSSDGFDKLHGEKKKTGYTEGESDHTDDKSADIVKHTGVGSIHLGDRASHTEKKDAGDKTECIKSESAHDEDLKAEQTSCDLHSFFQFCCSTYTGRVYIFDERGQYLTANFLPLDVELDNTGQLPDLLHHPQHLRLAQTFVRHWNSLTDTKRRLISKRGLKFRNPLAAYDQVRTDLTNNKQRYQTKEDQAKAAVKTAKEMNGKVRVVSKHSRPSQTSSHSPKNSKSGENGMGASGESVEDQQSGYVQVMSEDGTPLCLHCQQACSSLVSKVTLTSDDNAWHTRFCSRVCADAHWMKTNTAYLRSSVYDVQFGVCQLCAFDAHSFFCQIRDSPDMKQRAEKISKSRFSKLTAKQQKQMIAKPYEGLFWHVDHIRPVWEGGGQCDIDNLRTLCTPCHSSVTAKQATKRAHARRLSNAASAGDITAFFKKT